MFANCVRIFPGAKSNERCVAARKFVDVDVEVEVGVDVGIEVVVDVDVVVEVVVGIEVVMIKNLERLIKTANVVRKSENDIYNARRAALAQAWRVIGEMEGE